MENISKLLEVMAQLRHPDTGCEWDRRQTFATIAPYTIEEAYEVADAIHRGDREGLKDELGDLLLQVVFHARMAEEAGDFDFEDVAGAISAKLERRHPHIFGDGAPADEASVRRNWEAIKAAEREERHGAAVSLLDGIPRALPALKQAQKLAGRAAGAGFDWPDAAGVRRKIDEELAELDQELEAGPRERIEDEIGDLFFSLVNLARHAGIDAEAAAAAANRKFERRFRALEAEAAARGASVAALDAAELEDLWQAVKAGEAAPRET
ncbi:nucleoside triphosphate pyrophosphohydrolase [Lentisalinibacter salinarum]|uniref:nucleoside triphosphate pyrophosphohydrolase n=1 Tax=Lentisalinibacter salinarum TaxID=2992239 RepID=UPI00386C7F28